MNYELVYGALVDYYGKLRLYKIKDDGEWCVYAVGVSTGLNNRRYIYAVVPKNLSKGPDCLLKELDWISFQTRTTEEYHNVPAVVLFPSEQRKSVLKDFVTVVNRERDRTNYTVPTLPIKITLLHDPKKNNSLQYPDKMFLYQALETYQCLIEIL